MTQDNTPLCRFPKLGYSTPNVRFQYLATRFRKAVGEVSPTTPCSGPAFVAVVRSFAARNVLPDLNYVWFACRSVVHNTLWGPNVRVGVGRCGARASQLAAETCVWQSPIGRGVPVAELVSCRQDYAGIWNTLKVGTPGCFRPGGSCRVEGSSGAPECCVVP